MELKTRGVCQTNSKIYSDGNGINDWMKANKKTNDLCMSEAKRNGHDMKNVWLSHNKQRSLLFYRLSPERKPVLCDSHLRSGPLCQCGL